MAAQCRITAPGGMTPISQRGDLQHLANRLDSVQIPVSVDIGVHFFSWWSSSAWAKKALAVFRISPARRSSRFSRSRARIRSRSAVVTPGRTPLSISVRLTQSNSVVGVQPIFGAIEPTAAHKDGYSPRCSCTSRTARSRTSGENFVWFAMTPFSQSLEPPQNPGRFSCGHPARYENCELARPLSDVKMYLC